MATGEAHRPDEAPRAGRARLALGAAAAVLLLLGVPGVVRATAASSPGGTQVGVIDLAPAAPPSAPPSAPAAPPPRWPRCCSATPTRC